MICERCGCFFCDDDATAPGERPRKQYCRRKCAWEAWASAKRCWTRMPGCGGKRRYPKERHAIAALNRLQAFREAQGSDGMEKFSYQCTVCDGWHLTSREIPDPKFAVPGSARIAPREPAILLGGRPVR